jgi:hypothetical protein
VFGAQYDPTMANALIVGRYVWQFLTIVQAQSFDWWTAVTNLPCSPSIDGDQCATAVNQTAGYNSGLVYIDPNYNQTHDYNLYYTKRAFLLKHLTLHRPGSARYDIPQSQLPDAVHAIASKSAAAASGYQGASGPQTWNVLFLSNLTTPYNLTLAAPVPGAKLTKIYQTTNEVDWQSVEPLPASENGTAVVQLPAQSLVTLQFQ